MTADKGNDRKRKRRQNISQSLHERKKKRKNKMKVVKRFYVPFLLKAIATSWRAEVINTKESNI